MGGVIMETLLNWDHDLIPTTKEDLVLNLREHLRKFTGFAYSYIDAVRVEESNERLLVIELANVPGCPEYRLAYNFDSVHESHGRVGHIGLCDFMDEIEAVMFA